MHLVVGVAGTWLARRYALHRALIDHPGERRSHDLSTPRGGGLGIVAAVLLALVWLAWTTPSERGLFAAMAAGVAMVAGIGWADDHRPLPASLRLLVHALASSLLGAALLAHGAAPALAVGAAILALVLVNVWNFMDGINGLAASQAVLVALAYAVVAGGPAVDWLATALAVAALGFLPFNFPTARVFLGDVGSGAIGFALACVAALAWPGLPEAAGKWLLLLPLATFGVDAGLTLASRILDGQRWWEAHVTHAFQRWARRSGHGLVTLAYAAWTLLGVALMLLLAAWKGPGVVAAGAYLLAGMWLWWQLTSSGVRPVDSDE